MDEDRWIDFQDSQFRLSAYGQWVRAVGDPAASDGRAARMPGDHNQWAVQLAMPADLAKSGPWRCYAEVRVETQAPSGVALSLGIYDSEAKKSVIHRPVKIKESQGTQYQTIDLGEHRLAEGLYFWAAPAKRADVEAVYVDRVFLVRP